jgi:hypothetical protein
LLIHKSFVKKIRYLHQLYHENLTMTEIHFKKYNTLMGWVSFAVALIVYTLTVEPTVSFWDCGEFISTSAKLQIGHPPGAPLYQMIGAFFALFAPNPSQVALMVNMMSVFSSAFTILFMFWSSTLILRKVIKDEGDKIVHGVAILGSSFIGAMAFTFSDSFWYNAVEAEVYAMATFLIALLLWLGLRWEADMDKPRGNRWLLLICLIVGLSFGVHFMSLLTIPAIGLIYYFKNYQKITWQNFVVANVVVVAILLFIFKSLLPWTMALFGKTEVFMVNSLGLPFDSGTIFMTVLLIVLFYFGLETTRKRGLVFYNTLILCVLFIFIGFSTWLMLPIRANANVVINENRPSDAREVLAYYNREQYGHNPLFYGPQYTDTFAGLDPDQPYLDKAPNYERDYETGKYVITNHYKDATQNSHQDHMAVLPRLWSTDHIDNYISFTSLPNFKVDPEYLHENELVSIVSEFKQGFATGRFDQEDYITFLRAYKDYLIVDKPSFTENIGFMFEYQFGYMYWRYLMWNFTGRQSDNQGKYDALEGNWLSGIHAIDELRLLPQSNLPSDMKNNKGRNTYFFLPFLLGLIGFIFLIKRDLKWFYVLFVLFLFTGIALKVYLNERPFEPRERDYALVGSFYVFALWIGFGVFALYEAVFKKWASKLTFPLVFVVSLAAVPLLMAFQNWDDHDRSNKYTALSNAKAYLESCDPNAILFTIGDNDTFPLWYAQEIEGIRTDVRIVNTSLLMTDWYIDQMKARAYESAPLPISFDRKKYVGDNLDYIVYNPRTESSILLDDFIKFIANEDERTMVEMPNGQKIGFFPTQKITIPVDKEAVIRHNVVSKAFHDSIVPAMEVTIKSRSMYKNRIMMLDIINNNNWERPICFTGGSFSDEDYLWMKDYLQLQGLVYKLVPIKTPLGEQPSPMDMGMIDSDKMYDIVMKWDWGNGDRTDIYHDPETRKNSISYRSNLARLMEQLINEEKPDKAKDVIDLAVQKMPVEHYGFYTLLEPFVGGYYEIDADDEARALLDTLIGKYKEQLTYFGTLNSATQSRMIVEIVTQIERYRSLLQIAQIYDEPYFLKHRDSFNGFIKKFDRFKRKPL